MRVPEGPGQIGRPNTAADGRLALVILQPSHISTATAMVVAPGDIAVTTTMQFADQFKAATTPVETLASS